MNYDAFYLREALKEAAKGKGQCAPNPAVGAVVVKEGHVLGSGYHQGPGLAHAEVNALRGLSDAAKGATLYVTLEPCCHYGKTPPCTLAVRNSQLARVVYGYQDPNPVVSGKGVKELTEAGIVCEKVSLPEIGQFYESYAYWVRTGKPRVIAKIAVSLDGKIAGPGGVRTAISGGEAWKLTHERRKAADAILTTAKTILSDNPRLDARIGSRPEPKRIYVLDAHAEISPQAQVFQTAKSLTLLVAPDAPLEKRQRLSEHGARLVEVPVEEQGFCLDKVIEFIGEEGVHELWVEAGGKLFSQLVGERLLSQAYLYVAPKWLGKEAVPAWNRPTEALFQDAASLRWSALGSDALCEVAWN